jgi:hypothetical protein
MTLTSGSLGDKFDISMTFNERLAISRLLHRVGFGPKPGQFQAFHAKGFTSTASEVLALVGHAFRNAIDKTKPPQHD